jgi:murein DD-endopeptidase MepM/ murein hydrolase activator NlpD
MPKITQSEQDRYKLISNEQRKSSKKEGAKLFYAGALTGVLLTVFVIKFEFQKIIVKDTLASTLNAPQLTISSPRLGPKGGVQYENSYLNYLEVMESESFVFSEYLPLDPENSKVLQFPSLGETHGGIYIQNAIDFSCERNQSVLSIMSGIVTETGEDLTYGKYVIVKTSEKYGILNSNLLYAHLDKVLVNLGQVLEGGVEIGKCGSSGKLLNGEMPLHLHVGHINIDSFQKSQLKIEVRPFKNPTTNHSISILKLFRVEKFSLSESLSRVYKNVKDFINKNNLNPKYFLFSK